MDDDHGGDIFETNEFPLAYLLTFRTFGTWLHGDERESVGRNGRNRYGDPRIQPKREFESAMKAEMKRAPFILIKPMRRIVESAVKELCQRRGYVNTGAKNNARIVRRDEQHRNQTKSE